jgi:cyclophilin family peptidyl-prolyl cis-trans isomerase
MSWRQCATGLFLSVLLSSSGLAAPVIDPIADVTIPAGKSLIVPVTATSPTGQPLTYTVTSSTNGIAVVMHTNNPFWQLSVAQVADTNAPGAYQTPYRGGVATVTNVGNLTFMLFPEYAPHAVNVFQGLTTSGFYNSNTIFHRVVTNFVIQGGDPLTNGTGRLVFTYDDEFNPQAMFSGNGQLALANSGKDTDGPQFFVTVGAQRPLDFKYTLFGQLVRGFAVLTNLSHTAVDTNSRPLADEIIQTASYVPDTADTALTLTATNVPGVTGTITVIADDGVGGRTTNVFAATLVADINSTNQSFIYPNTVTNLVAPVNRTLTNFINAVELDSDTLYWFPSFVTEADYNNATNSSYNLSSNVLRTLTYNVTNVGGRFQLFLVPARNYAGPVSLVFDVSYNSYWNYYQQYGYTLPNYDQQVYTFVFGDTPVSGQSKTVTALASVPFNNVLLATFTNGVPGSSSTNFTAAINWGDNSTNSGVVTANPAGEKAVLGSHTYVYPGTYPVYVQVQSAIGASATVLSFVTVTNQAAAATNLLTVQVSGPGTVSPDYNNASLLVGGSYSISAIPADLSVLASWTDGNGFVLGTGTNLTFTMYPGLRLTANFEPATPPSLTITSPSARQAITNLYSALATVAGTAANNATVTSVWYQVNSAGWQPASGTTNWTASFTPLYGVTNLLEAYAVNNYGYLSTTSSVSALYEAGAPLTLYMNGLGSISPALNGQLLVVGNDYELTAIPTSGFIFANWTGSLFSTNPVLSFTMATNSSFTASFVSVDANAAPWVAITSHTNLQLVIGTNTTLAGIAYDLGHGNRGITNVTVNGARAANDTASSTNIALWSKSVALAGGTNTFTVVARDGDGNARTNVIRLLRDITRPTIVIAQPSANQYCSNALFTAIGSATDNLQVSNVRLQLNGGDWTNAALPNNSTNWNASLNLRPGTNTLAAYSVDSSGNVSMTNRVSFVYVVSAPLQLQITGRGTLSPNYSNAWLAINRTYSMTATPQSGFAFVNWTGGTNLPLAVLTNGRSVRFSMTSNLTLQANFVDTNKPACTITSPTSNQRWSNVVVTVKGTAKDNVGVDNVWYQLNGSAWTNSTTANGWTNWTVDVVLVPGTNVVRAYAVDGAGNKSTTNSVNFIYVVSDRLQVRAAGQGTLSPNYSNAVLEIGKSYSMKTSGVNGHVFTNWVVSTNWVGGVISNNATLKFLMQSNLTLQANFADVTKPTLAITAPTANQRWSNAPLFIVMGTAKDNVQVSNVWCLTNEVWVSASLGSGRTNWAIDVTLVAGTNTVRAYAEDAAGNRSPTNSVKFVYVPCDRLQVSRTGLGTVSPNYSNAFLEIGRTFTLTAKPAGGYLFSNWTDNAGTQITNAAGLRFQMQSNLSFTANFVPNPFLPVTGTYQGLFHDTNGVAFQSAGFFNATVKTNGVFSAKLSQGTNSYPFTGQFSLAGVFATNSIPRRGLSPLSAQLFLDFGGGDDLTGWLSDGIWTAELLANRAVYSPTNPAPQSGRKYTLVIPGSEDSSQEPGGYGFGTVGVDTSGTVSFSGSLGDGAKVTQSAIVSRQGYWPLYVPLYSGNGSIWGWLTFTNDPESDLSGSVNWIKLAQASAKLYPAGFTNWFDAVGSVYSFTNGVRVLSLTNGVATFEGGNLSQSITNQFWLGTNNLVTGSNTLSLKITTTSGLFQGGFINPATGKSNSFSGALLQKQNAGYGYFLGTNQTGSVTLQKSD